MKQDIENIIDKKHNELFKIDFNLDYNTKLNLQRAILDSLSYEVLKVVVETRVEIIKRLQEIRREILKNDTHIANQLENIIIELNK